MSDVYVSCKAGKFKGFQNNNVNFFYGIPYAKTLTKESQWLAPEKIDRKVILEVKKPGFSAPQTNYGDSFLRDPTMPSESLDCLSLNISSKNKNRNMPVMIWIHGGAYVTGSSNSAVYELASLPLRNVVLVTINYRLGPFGFLKLNEVTNGLIKSSGNEGLMDQKLAIQWVKENISEFGGNPDNITLFGESAGAWSVALQASINSCGNLFSKAICQSGGMNAYFHKERANEWAELFIKTAFDKGYKTEDLFHLAHCEITKIATCMKHTMIASGKWLTPEIGFAPVADGNFLPLEPLKNFKNSKIKLIIGTNADEYRLWSEFEPYYLNLSKENFFKRLKKIFRDEAVPKIANLYVQDNLSENKYKHALSSIMTDWTFGIHTLEILEQHASNSYGYFFDEPSPILDGKLGAYHASELPYVFGSSSNKNFREFCSENADVISNFFQVSWTQFAKTGSPSSDLCDWQPYAKNKSITIINSSSKTQTYKNIDKIKFLHESKINH